MCAGGLLGLKLGLRAATLYDTILSGPPALNVVNGCRTISRGRGIGATYTWQKSNQRFFNIGKLGKINLKNGGGQSYQKSRLRHELYADKN